jgi:uncharacterized membrane protein
MKKNLVTAIVLLIAVIPFIYLALMYHSLPPQVATHFSISGKPDRFSDKSSLIMFTLLLQGIAVGQYFLLINIHRIDPKKSAKLSTSAMQKIAVRIVVLLTAIMILIMYGSTHNHVSLEKVMIPLLGLFFAYLGNLMHSVKPNYFVGIRTPWTLEDEDTWRKTHQLAGKLWFAGGVIIAIVGLLLSHQHAVYILIIIMIFITLIPVIYSYKYYQAHRRLPN